jgi:hypothetical protein
MPLMPMAGGASLREAPVILSETMIFPYFRGLVFCAALTNQGGWEALNKAYERPPQSTEQVLHPQKYLSAEPDRPTAVDLGSLDPGPGWSEVGRNVVGEMQLGVMLRSQGGKKAGAGWDGDRFAVFEGPDERLGLVWFSTWDDEDEAREFAGAYAAYQAGKIASESPRFAGTARDRNRGDWSPTYVVERRGTDVVVVEGFSPERTNLLVQSAFRAGKSEISDISLEKSTVK